MDYVSKLERDGTVSKNMETLVTRTCPCADNLQKKEDAVGAYVRYMTKVVEWS